MPSVQRNTYSSGCAEGFNNPRLWQPPLQTTHAGLRAGPTIPHTPEHQLFEVNAETSPGDTLVIVGSVPALGNWDAHRGMRMTTSDDVYPLWHAWIPGCLPGCEYKFAILKRSGEVEWEQSNNRRLAPLTNRVAAIFGVAREVTRTRASDAALFATRHAAEPPQRPPPVRVQLPHASVQVPPVTRPSNAAAAAAVAAAAVATAAKAATNSAPEWPKPHPAPPRSVPPPLALDASFVPFVPVIGGASADSTPCNSRPVSRTASHSSLRRNGSSLSGSRVSFSKNLVDLADAAGRSVPVK